MRSRSTLISSDSAAVSAQRGDWKVLALSFLVLAKLANVGVPLIMKQVVDALDQPKALVVVPLVLLIAYGLLRLSTTLFTELRDLVFARVTQRAIRRIALQVFRHLHALSLRFHLERQTGGVSRDVERGTRGIETLMRFTIFSIFPTLLEMALVAAILITKYDVWFALITLGTLTIYISLTIGITEIPARHERDGFQGQYARDRQPAQLRNGQVFRQ
jgi:ATP-binding cassette, subfamily B, heavy metal transporter